MRILFGLHALCLAATPALACPGPGDVMQGVVMTALDGTTDTFLQVSPDFVQGTYLDGAGDGSQYLLMRGVYLVEAFDIVQGQARPETRAAYTYPPGPADVPMPVPEGRWDTGVTVLDRGEVRQMRESFEFGAETRITIGECGYRMIPVLATYHDEGGFQERLHYLPELGFAYLAATLEPGQAPAPVVYVRIELARP